MLEPISFRVVIKPDPVEKKTKSGLVLALDEKLEEGATQTGTIISIGPDVYAAFKPSLPYAGLEIGQRVSFAKYSGKWVKDDETGINYLIVNDEDIVVILKGESKNDSENGVEANPT